MILTNGQVWQVSHPTAGLPVALDLALEVNLLGDRRLAEKADALFYLSKDAFKRHAVDDLWKLKAATSAKSLATVITNPAVLDQIRKELRRQKGHNIDACELRDLITSTVLRAEALALE